MKTNKLLLIIIPILGVISGLSLLMVVRSSAHPDHQNAFSESAAVNNDLVDRWLVLADLERGRGDPGVVVVNDKIHVISGYFTNGFNYVNNQEVYDLQTDTWQNIWGIPEPRSDFVALYHDEKIYTIGGWRDPEDPNIDYDIEGSLDFNHVYDPVQGKWDTDSEAPLLTPVSGAAGVVLDDKFYIIGGYTNILTETNQVQIYDPINKIWEEGTAMNSARSGLGAVVLNGLIYVIGGQSASDPRDVEIYNPIDDTWSDGPALPERRSRMAVTVRQGKIYVMGGIDPETKSVKDSMFVYDPDTGLWATGDPMPTARHASRAAVVGDTIHVIGGVGEPGSGKANEAYGGFPPFIYLPLVKR